MYNGCDISVVQQQVDFEWLKSQGLSFVINRCWVGNEYRDIHYVRNMNEGKNAGLCVAAYNFPYPLPTDGIHVGRDPLAQAEMHFKAVDGLTENVAADIEWPEPGPDWQKWGVSAAFINEWVMKYLERYTQLSGRKPLVYTYPWFAKSVNFSKDIAQYPLWIASPKNPPEVPAPFTDWIINQNTYGTVLKLPNGIGVDTDIAKDLSWFGVVEQPPVEQTPVITIQPEPTPTITQAPPPVVQTSTQPQEQSNDAVSIIQSILNIVIPIIKKLFHIR